MDVNTTTKTINICVINSNIDFESMEAINDSSFTSKYEMIKNVNSNITYSVNLHTLIYVNTIKN
jgi:hypothetical protein